MRLAVSIAVLLSASLSAQSTWIVDEAGGPGSHFAEIQPAINAAAPGDIISVRAGVYDAIVVVGKGVTIRGTGAVTIVGESGLFPPVFNAKPAVRISGVPRTQTMVLADLRVVATADAADAMRIQSSPGRVHLQSVDVAHGPLWIGWTGAQGIEIRNSGSVTLTDCTVNYPPRYGSGFASGIDAAGSNVALSRTKIHGQNYALLQTGGFPLPVYSTVGLVANNCNLWLSRCHVEGGSGGVASPPTVPFVPSASAAMRVTNSAVTVSGLPSHKIYGGDSGRGAPAISAITSTVVVDDDVDVRGGNGVSALVGGVFEQRVVPEVDAYGGRLGDVIITSVSAQPQDIVLLFLGSPGPTSQSAWGLIWVDLSSVYLVTAEVLPPAGITGRAVMVPYDLALRGLTVGFQAARWDHVSGAVEMSNVTDITVW